MALFIHTNADLRQRQVTRGARDERLRNSFSRLLTSRRIRTALAEREATLDEERCAFDDKFACLNPKPGDEAGDRALKTSAADAALAAMITIEEVVLDVSASTVSCARSAMSHIVAACARLETTRLNVLSTHSRFRDIEQAFASTDAEASLRTSGLNAASVNWQRDCFVSVIADDSTPFAR